MQQCKQRNSRVHNTIYTTWILKDECVVMVMVVTSKTKNASS